MWLFSLFQSLWKPIAGLLAGLLVLFQRWRIKRKDEQIDRQEQVIKAHQAKEQVHEQDRALEAEADQKIEDIQEKVNAANSPQEAAQAVTDGLNTYFGAKNQ